MTSTTLANPLILVDGSSYLYRAFHALPALTSSKGEPTGAIHGVIAMLRKLLKEYQPSHIAVVFDAPGKTFRDTLYSEYKAHRPSMPEELVAQIQNLHAIIQAMGIPLVMTPGVEADDVIGTYATLAGQRGIETIISSGDKDFAQLVTPHVHLMNTMDNIRLDREEVYKKFGVFPEQIVDYLTLVGDKVDNVPGVPKVGPKTAATWLAKYGTLDEIIKNADEISGKIGENLRNSLGYLPLSRQLVTIVCNLQLDISLEQLQLLPPKQAELKEWYSRLEFKTWLSELIEAQNSNLPMTENSTVSVQYELIVNQSQFDLWLQRLAQAELICIDTETTSLDYMQAQIVGLSFCVQSSIAAYVPLAHDYPGAPVQLQREAVLQALKSILEDENKPKLGQNLKYDMSVFANHGITLQGVTHDSMLESYVLDSTATRHDMDSLALKYLSYKTIHFEDVAGKGSKQVTFNQVPVEHAKQYAAEDVDITLQLHQHFWPKLQNEPGLKSLYQEIEIPLISVLSRMERNGVQIDAQMLATQSGQLAERILELEEEAYALAGQTFNLASPKQIQEILYDKLQIPVTAKTPTGQPSTAEAVLQDLAMYYPLPRLLLEHRGLSKLKSTYTDSLPQQINPLTGRIHTSYHQAVAATGRLSSTDPNLQNIPIRTEEGRRIRRAFVAREGYCLVAADYSQIELRIMAHLSEDESLLKAFAAGDDIHSATAAEVFGVPLAQVSSEHRRTAKAINFGLIYGMSAFGLAKQLGIERQSAQRYVDRYFAKYLGVKRFMDQIREQARAQGYVETVFKRRLYLPEINSRNAQRRQYAERTAINAPMQGTAADIIKRAMIAVDDWLLDSKTDARLIMQVHDELVLEVKTGEVDFVTQNVVKIMEQAANLKVPLTVGYGVGKNWEEAH